MTDDTLVRTVQEILFFLREEDEEIKKVMAAGGRVEDLAPRLRFARFYANKLVRVLDELEVQTLAESNIPDHPH